MASDAQIAANRANAKKSTGPKTVEGKRVSRRNAVQHGLRSRLLVAYDEDWDEYRKFYDRLYADLLPESAFEQEIVGRLIYSAWCMRRAWRAEGAAIDKAARVSAETMARRILAEELHANPPPDLDPGDAAAVDAYVERRLKAMPREEVLSFLGRDQGARLDAWPAALTALTRYQSYHERALNRGIKALLHYRQEREERLEPLADWREDGDDEA